MSLNDSFVRPPVVNIFVSSPFSGLQDERKELALFAFRELRTQFEPYDIIINDIDFRWGITEEQLSQGQLLPICFDGIDMCRPFFIGILGKYYGTLLSKIRNIPSSLIAKHPWLAEQQDKSITEAEFIYGALREPEKATHAFFYFWEEESPVRQIKDLKQRVWNTFPDRVRTYHSVRELRENVVFDLTGAIKSYSEQNGWFTLNTNQINRQVLYAQAKTFYTIARTDGCYDILERYATEEEEGPGLVIFGEAGVGKSTACADFFLKFRNNHPHHLVYACFIGTTIKSIDISQVLYQILHEIGQLLDFKQEINTGRNEDIHAQFLKFLHSAIRHKNIVILIDGIDKLESGNRLTYTWLPEILPKGLKIIVSTCNGPILEYLRGMGWMETKIDLFSRIEQENLIASYYSPFFKSISIQQMEKLLGNPLSMHPLFLSIALEEMRMLASPEELDRNIAKYVTMTSIDELLSAVFDGWKSIYEEKQLEMFERLFSLLWASRTGLSIQELRELLGKTNTELTQVLLLPLLNAVKKLVFNNAGRFMIAHHRIELFIESRYLSNNEYRLSFHGDLADYFEKKPLSHRLALELPWQYLRAEKTDRLVDRISDVSFFKFLFEHHTDNLCYYLTAANAQSRIKDTLITKLNRWEKEYLDKKELATFLHSLGNFFSRFLVDDPTAKDLLEHALNVATKSHGEKDLFTARILKDLGHINSLQMNNDRARDFYYKAKQIYEDKGNDSSLDVALCYMAIAGLKISAGNKWKEAKMLLESALQILHSYVGEMHQTTAECKKRLAHCIRQIGSDSSFADNLDNEALVVYRKLYHPGDFNYSFYLQNLAYYMLIKKDWENAEYKYREAYTLEKRYLGAEHPDTLRDLHNLAMVLSKKGSLMEAREIFGYLYDITRKGAFIQGLEKKDLLFNFAMTHLKIGDFQRAKELIKDALRNLTISRTEEMNKRSSLEYILTTIDQSKDDLPTRFLLKLLADRA